jgi:pimeloyl-ACP methyl ester carboxylesterase
MTISRRGYGVAEQRRDANVESCLNRFTWRILSNYVTPWEFEQITTQIEVWDQWCSVWSSWADAHARRGDEAAEQGSSATAADAYIRAGLFYHWASFLFANDLDQFRAALEGANSSFERAAPHLSPPMRFLYIPFEGTHLPAYLRFPARHNQAHPLMVLIPGGDSTKEELFNLSEHLTSRGVAILAVDGPGHGLVSFDLKLRPDFEVAGSTILDFVENEVAGVDLSRLGVGGISYGGLFACRTAAFDKRVKAVFSMSSWYTPAGRWHSIDPLSQSALYQYMGSDAPDVQASMTMKGAAEHIAVPLLQVYGGADPASPPEHAYRVEAEVQGPATTVVFDDGVHVCNNIWHKARPFVADWVVDTL